MFTLLLWWSVSPLWTQHVSLVCVLDVELPVHHTQGLLTILQLRYLYEKWRDHQHDMIFFFF